MALRPRTVADVEAQIRVSSQRIKNETEKHTREGGNQYAVDMEHRVINRLCEERDLLVAQLNARKNRNADTEKATP